MKQIILYGAGIRGKKVAQLLDEHGVQIAGFCDSQKTGKVYWGNDPDNVSEIISLEDIDSDKYIAIITIANYEQAAAVKVKLNQRNIEVVTVEQFLFQNQDRVTGYRDFIAQYHLDKMEDYFQNAEQLKYMERFWSDNSIFKGLFKKLNTDRIVELACGRGRHVSQYISDAQEVILVDVLEKNINYCKERFCNNSKISFYVNNGKDLKELKSKEYTALFTYDAMVHFELFDVYQYLKETYRILVEGGRALFHHSNNTQDYRITFSTGTSGRNYMSKEIFAYLAYRAGFTVLEQHEIEWEGYVKLDCLTLVEK